MLAIRYIVPLFCLASIIHSGEFAWTKEINDAPANCFTSNPQASKEDLLSRRSSVSVMLSQINDQLKSSGVRLTDEELATQARDFLFSKNLPSDLPSAAAFSEKLRATTPKITALIQQNCQQWKKGESLAEKYLQSMSDAELVLSDFIEKAKYKWSDTKEIYNPNPNNGWTITIDLSSGPEWVQLASKDFSQTGLMSVPPSTRTFCNKSLLARLYFQYELHGQMAREKALFSFACNNHFIGRFGLIALQNIKEIRNGKKAAEISIQSISGVFGAKENSEAIWNVKSGDIYTFVDLIEKNIVSEDEQAQQRVEALKIKHKQP